MTTPLFFEPLPITVGCWRFVEATWRAGLDHHAARRYYEAGGRELFTKETTPESFVDTSDNTPARTQDRGSAG